MTRIIGLDPGTSSSPSSVAMLEHSMSGKYNLIGIVPIDLCKSGLLFAARTRIISSVLLNCIRSFTPDMVVIETSVYMGRANIMHQQLLGAIEASLDDSSLSKLCYVYPTSVKKCMGHGRMEKEEVANEVLKRINKGKPLVEDMITGKFFDMTDSIAIAICGHEKGYVNEKEV